MARLDAYIRVSRADAKRRAQGESYISPTVQREAIEHWAEANGVMLGKVVKEENVSGGKAVKDRALEELVQRCESAASDGIIVYRLNRFARSQAETHVAAYRIKQAKRRLVAVSDGYDSEAPGGAYVLAFMAVEAEKYLADVRENWAAAAEHAVGRGVHIACRAPVGYRRKDEVDPEYNDRRELVKDGRLLVADEAEVKHVLRAFELRAEGWSYRRIAAYLTEAGLKPRFSERDKRRAGWKQWSATGVSDLLRNPVYTGSLYRKDRKVGEFKLVKKDTHDVVVSPELFAVVQATMGQDKFHGRNGALSVTALLPGLVRCAGCGHPLQIMGSTSKSTGVREASYTCPKKWATGDCPEPASMRVKLVDERVLFLLAQPEISEALRAASETAESRWLEAKAEVDAAEVELDHWVETPGLRVTLGDAKFEKGIKVRAEALDEARRALWELEDPGIPEGATVATIDGTPYVYELWDEMSIERKRQQFRRIIASVTVSKADPKRRRWQPFDERIDVRFCGVPGVY
jgi:DNA invertase Pin-like site-specific DNA recombinase